MSRWDDAVNALQGMTEGCFLDGNVRRLRVFADALRDVSVEDMQAWTMATFAVQAHTQDWDTITGKPATFPPSAHTQDWSTVTGKPTTLAGYGINDAVSAASQASASRSLNSAFQVSATRGALVVYSVQITVTASIAGGQNGDVILEIASNAGFTNNVQTLAISGVGQTYTLAVALQGVQPQTSPVMGFVPTGYYVRLRTVNNVGTPSYSFRAGQETLL